ncbi:hypothetical protein ACLB2K_010979 [Fragaria x ananassa]
MGRPRRARNSDRRRVMPRPNRPTENAPHRKVPGEVEHPLDEAAVLSENLEGEAAAREVVEDARVVAGDVHAAAEAGEVDVDGGFLGVAAEDYGVGLHVVLEVFALELRESSLHVTARRHCYSLSGCELQQKMTIGLPPIYTSVLSPLVPTRPRTPSSPFVIVSLLHEELGSLSMKHIVKILTLLVTISALWIGLLQTAIIPRSHTWLLYNAYSLFVSSSQLPIYFVVSLGCYGLLMVGVGLVQFPTCPQEAVLLQQDVVEAKEYLKQKGVDVGGCD